MNKGLYIHFPFCDAKCPYCDFFSVPDMRKKDEYEKALAKAILSMKNRNFSFDTVFFGGGTPSLMSYTGAERIFDAIHTAFHLSSDAEITLEANPSEEKMFENKLEFFKKLGVNRLSLGAQSMCNNELKKLGRRHSAENTVQCVKTARSIGFDNISLDFMVHIPSQTLQTLDETLEKAVSLSPQHFSFYNLSIEEKTVFGAKIKRGDSLDLAKSEDEELMWEKVCKVMHREGFKHYEVSNFAKPNYFSRHNLKYWRTEEYLGVGASAHSYIDSVRYSSPKNIGAFINDPLKRENEESINGSQKALEYIMLSLRLSDGISFDKLEKEYGVLETKSFLCLKEKLIEAKLAEESEDHLFLTESGWRVSNSIIFEVLSSLNLM